MLKIKEITLINIYVRDLKNKKNNINIYLKET